MQFISDLTVPGHSAGNRPRCREIDRRRLVGGGLAAMLAGRCLSGAAPARAGSLTDVPAVLLMVDEPGCPYCLRWEREVMPGYVNSAEGKVAPLVRRRRGDPAIAFIPNVVYTPTFVLLRQGREAGRIIGYPGAELFWMNLATLMRQAGLAQGT